MVSIKPLSNFIAFGNCLVDQSVQLTSDDILKRHNLNHNDVGECSQAVLNEIIKDVKQENLTVNVHLGGSALNTCRILNKISDARILFCGAVGADDNGKFVQRELKKLGIDAFLQISSTESTGTCICLVHQQDRCCFANIGASKHFSTKNFPTLDSVTNSMEKVVVYIEGFFLTERSQICRYIVEQFSQDNSSNITFAINLSACYIVENHLEDVNYLVSKADIIFGNTDEFEVLAKCNQKSTVIELIYSMNEDLEKRDKIIVITNGNQPIEIYTFTLNEPFKWETLDVRLISKNDVVDTTGAGDSFVAGFFHSFLKNKSIKDCANFGMEVAVKKLKKSVHICDEESG